MAQSTFPGGNPFSATSGMNRVAEEDEHDTINSPTSSHFPGNPLSSGPPPSSTSFSGDAVGDSPFGSFSPPPSAFPTNYNFNRRTSVSAESMNPTTEDDNWKPPYHEKNPEQLARLKASVSSNFLFSHLDDEQSSQVLGALMEKPIPAKGIKIISQGDSGDYFYVVEKGSFDIYINPVGHVEPGPEGMGNKVATVKEGGSFGELALMYNSPRAATVVSNEPSNLWALDRLTFRRILMDSAFNRRRMYESFLEEVPLLSTLEPYERAKIADALDTIKFADGDVIIEEGEPGDSFYFLESGEAEVFKRESGDTPIKRYKKGDYFGELALLNAKPRAASVIAKGEAKVARLGMQGFQRLLGPVEEIMRRHDYNKPAAVDDPLA